MPSPTLTAITSTGQQTADPSEDLLFMLFEDIVAGACEYFVVQRESDRSGQTYVQTIPEDDRWIVEYRDGGPDRHFQATFADMRAAHEVVTRWCFGHEPELLAAVDWQRVTFD